jgi:hypothetical protein
LLQDFIQALDIVDVAMKDSIRKLSSFDRYKGEVLSGNLDWTPMHKDPVFWRDNITKFADNDFQVNFTLSLFHKLYFLNGILVHRHRQGHLTVNIVECLDIRQPNLKFVITDMVFAKIFTGITSSDNNCG